MSLSFSCRNFSSSSSCNTRDFTNNEFPHDQLKKLSERHDKLDKGIEKLTTDIQPIVEIVQKFFNDNYTALSREGQENYLKVASIYLNDLDNKVKLNLQLEQDLSAIVEAKKQASFPHYGIQTNKALSGEEQASAILEAVEIYKEVKAKPNNLEARAITAIKEAKESLYEAGECYVEVRHRRAELEQVIRDAPQEVTEYGVTDHSPLDDVVD